MKKSLFILALVICLTFAACGDTAKDNQNPSTSNTSQGDSQPGDSQNTADSGDSEATEVIPYDQLQTDMYLLRETRTNSDGSVVTDILYSYDSEGRVLSAINADGSGYRYEYPDYSTEIEYHLSEGGEVYQKWVREYDGKHQLMSSICYDSSGKLIGGGMSYSYSYSEPNMISQIKQYTTDLEHYNVTDIEYSNGNVTKNTHKDEDGNIISVQTYEFDEQGRTISSADKDYTTGWESSARYEYSQDENGSTVTVCYLNDSDTPEYKNIFDSEGRLVLDINYDNEGKENIKTEVVRDGENEVTTTYIYGVISSRIQSQGSNYVRMEEYTTDGELSMYTITESSPTKTTYSYYDADDKLTSKTVYEYAADGRPLSTIIYDAQGNATPYDVYTYDENNLLIKEENSWYAESGTSVVTYEYIKINGVYRTLEIPYGHD